MAKNVLFNAAIVLPLEQTVSLKLFPHPRENLLNYLTLPLSLRIEIVMGLFPGKRKSVPHQGIGMYVIFPPFLLDVIITLVCIPAVLSVELCQVGNIEINQSKILAAVVLIQISRLVPRNLRKPKVGKKLRENRPKNFCESKITPIHRMMISALWQDFPKDIVPAVMTRGATATITRRTKLLQMQPRAKRTLLHLLVLQVQREVQMSAVEVLKLIKVPRDPQELLVRVLRLYDARLHHPKLKVSTCRFTSLFNIPVGVLPSLGKS